MLSDPPRGFLLLTVLVPLPGRRRWLGLTILALILLGLANVPWIAARIGVRLPFPDALRTLSPTILLAGNVLAIVLLAIAALRVVMHDNPSLRLARKLQRRGDHRGAAELYLRAGKPKVALQAFKRARAWSDAARIAHSLGRELEAAELFRKAGGEHFAQAARLYGRLGNDEMARHCYQDLAQWHLGAGRYAEGAAAWFRAGEPVRAARAAELALERGELRPGINEYRIAVQAAEAARHHTLLARLAEQIPDFERAGTFWAAAGDHARAAQAFLRAEDLERAAKHFDLAGDRKQATTVLYRYVKERAAHPGNRAAAQDDGTPPAGHAPFEQKVETALARLQELGMQAEYIDLLQTLERIDEAVAWLSAHQKRAEAADIAYQAQRWDLAAPILEELGRYGEASDAYELMGDLSNAARCAELDQEDDRALGLYRRMGDRAAAARCMARLGEVQDALAELVAIEKFDEAWDLLRLQPGRVPDIPEVILDLSEALYDQGRLYDAIACLQRAVSGVALTPERIPPTLALARFLMEAGDLEAAKRQVGRILELDYSHRPAQELGKKIDQLRAVGSPAETQAIETAIPSPVLSPGSDQERYEILTEIGRGGMGVVFKAIDRKLERVVAVKVLKTTSAAEAARLEEEAKAAATLNHPSIVTVYDFEQGLGSYLIAMEYVDGQPLDKLLKTGADRIKANLMTILPALAEAVAYAHDHKVIHRDLKPGNILLTVDNRVKIFDFGIATRLDMGGPEAAKVCGTPFYMAPEQIRGEPPSPSSDIYSLGATFYHLATGRPPFSHGNILEAHIRETPANPIDTAPWISPGLARIILKCLEKDPADRYPNAHELHHDLVTLRHDGPAGDMEER